MRALLQRVRSASVSVDKIRVSQIARGLLVLLGIRYDDSVTDAEFLAQKIVNLRLFDDERSIINRSLLDIGGELLVVSQFTLYADTRRGLRPSWSEAAKPEIAKPLYEKFIAETRRLICLHGNDDNKSARVKSGIFRSSMQVELINDGPVTLMLESRKDV